MIVRMSLPWLGLLLLGACAHREEMTVETVGEEPVQAVADMLALADRSAQGGNRQGLAAALSALDGRGARPAEADADPVPAWRRLANPVPPVRGRMLGPAYRRGTLAGGTSMTLMQLFDGGKQARVAIATPGDEPLGIAVLDGNGKPICPTNVARRGSCAWVPPFSGRHQIVLSNPGAARSSYYLVIE